MIFLDSVQLSKVEKVVFPLLEEYSHGSILSQAGHSEEYHYLSLLFMLLKSNERFPCYPNSQLILTHQIINLTLITF